MGSLVFAAVLALMVPPAPTPIGVQTEAPLFDNAHFFYQGEDNNPKKHPVPPEYQSGRNQTGIYAVSTGTGFRKTASLLRGNTIKRHVSVGLQRRFADIESCLSTWKNRR